MEESRRIEEVRVMFLDIIIVVMRGTGTIIACGASENYQTFHLPEPETNWVNQYRENKL